MSEMITRARRAAASSVSMIPPRADDRAGEAAVGGGVSAMDGAGAAAIGGGVELVFVVDLDVRDDHPGEPLGRLFAFNDPHGRSSRGIPRHLIVSPGAPVRQKAVASIRGRGPCLELTHRQTSCRTQMP